MDGWRHDIKVLTQNRDLASSFLSKWFWEGKNMEHVSWFWYWPQMRNQNACVRGMWVSPEVSDGDKDLLAHRAEERMQGLLFHQHLQWERTSEMRMCQVTRPNDQRCGWPARITASPSVGSVPGRTVARPGVYPLEPDPEVWLCLLLAVWAEMSYLTFLYLSFLICKMK